MGAKVIIMPPMKNIQVLIIIAPEREREREKERNRERVKECVRERERERVTQ